MPNLRRICSYCLSESVPKRSLCVALFVGTLLNLINQGDALFGAASLNVTKITLTYLVPYCVATYGAVSYRLRASARNNAELRDIGAASAQRTLPK